MRCFDLFLARRPHLASNSKCSPQLSLTEKKRVLNSVIAGKIPSLALGERTKMPFRWFNRAYIYIRFSKYEKVGVLPIRIVKSNVSSVGPSSERNRKKKLLLFFFRQYTNLFIFRFVSLLCLRSTPRLYTIIKSVTNIFGFSIKILLRRLSAIQNTLKIISALSKCSPRSPLENKHFLYHRQVDSRA